MTKAEAIREIKALQCGALVNLNKFPTKLQSREVQRCWTEDAFVAGAAVGYMAGLIDLFDII